MSSLIRKAGLILACALLFCAAGVRAQDENQGQDQNQNLPGQNDQNQPDQNQPQAPIQPAQPIDNGAANGEGHQLPVPAGRGLFGGNGDEVDTPIANDTHALTGAEAFGNGYPIGTHNLFDAALHLTIGGDTGLVPGETNFFALPGALLSLNHSWDSYQTTIAYAGAGSLYAPASNYNTGFQDLSAAQTIRWRRTTLRFRNDFTQSAGATFGGLSIGGPGLTMPVGLVAQVSPTFVPSDTIQTGQTQEINDAAIGELDYQLSRRSVLTFAGSYGVLHFLTSGFIDTQLSDGRVGYGYQLDRANSFGFLYDFQHILFSDGAGFVTSNVIQATYGRLLPARTALQISAGPQYIMSNAFGVTIPSQWSWSLFAQVTHHVRRTTYSASYNHGVTNGSGVLLGATTETATGAVSQAFTRIWTGTVSGGYAYNSNLPTNTMAAGTETFSNWYVSGNLSRLWGRRADTNFSYELQEQTGTFGVCPVASCGTTYLRQVFSVTVDFHIRPIGLE